MGSCCGAVGTRDPWSQSSHWQFYFMSTVSKNCNEMMKIKKKRLGMAQFLKIHSLIINNDSLVVETSKLHDLRFLSVYNPC